MSNRMKQALSINGKTIYATGTSVSDLLQSCINLYVDNGVLERCDTSQQYASRCPLFGNYVTYFFDNFKSDQQSNTIVNRNRMLKNHINPAFGDLRLDQITAEKCRVWFKNMGTKYSHETLLKIRNIMSPVMDTAIQEGYIKYNPLKSKKISIGGRKTVSHQALPKNKADEIRNNTMCLTGREKHMAALLISTGMRFEQILGLRWEDINVKNKTVKVERAVVHPTRNAPQIKDPKTESSNRIIPIADITIQQLSPMKERGFILTSDNGTTPLSYSEARRVFNKIRNAYDIKNYTAHDFRDTCATEWREHGVAMDIIARMLGHAKTETTEKRYVKYREQLFKDARSAMNE